MFALASFFCYRKLLPVVDTSLVTCLSCIIVSTYILLVEKKLICRVTSIPALCKLWIQLIFWQFAKVFYVICTISLYCRRID